MIINIHPCMNQFILADHFYLEDQPTNQACLSTFDELSNIQGVA